MQGTNDQAAEGEADIGGNQHGAGKGGRQTADGEDKDGCVKKHGPAGSHEAELGEAGQQDAAVSEDGERDDGVLGAGLDEEEEGESQEREEDGNDPEGTGEAVEEEDDGDGLGLLVVGNRYSARVDSPRRQRRRSRCRQAFAWWSDP